MFYKDSNTLCSFPNSLTKFYFLFGTNICHSLSPTLHSSWFRKYELNAIYLPATVKDEDDFISLLKKLLLIEEFSGGNITMPFKHAALGILEFEQEQEVQITKAANTIFRKKNTDWALANTDIYGIEKTIEFLIEPQQEFDILLLGGGGAASSALYAGQNNVLCRQILCLTRNPEKTTENFSLINRPQKLNLRPLTSSSLKDAVNYYQVQKDKRVLIINTIPFDILNNQGGNFAVYLLENLTDKNRIFYFDMTTSDTQAIQIACNQGIRNTNGRLMLEAQACKSFSYWTGIWP
jgi:shikimate dehydrogenase